MEPVYLSSIILGSLYHGHHLSRALYGRIWSALQPLPAPYQRHKPLLSGISNTECRQPGKAPSFSCIWSVHQPTLTVIQNMTGRTEEGAPAYICKKHLLRQWVGLQAVLPAPLTPGLSSHALYGDLKASATTYQAAKATLYQAFMAANLGAWVKKPMEQDMFELGEEEPSAGGASPMEAEPGAVKVETKEEEAGPVEEA